MVSSSTQEVAIGSAIGGVATVLAEKIINHPPRSLGEIVPTTIHVQSGDVLTFAVVTVAIFFAWRSQKIASLGVAAPDRVTTAMLRLHVYGDERLPERLGWEHVFRWYFLTSVVKALTPDRGIQDLGTMQILFIAFEPDVAINTLRVTSPDLKLPPHEVKEFNQRFAIIAFMEAIPTGTLEITVAP